MSHSEHHKEKRGERAKQKAKENRVHRNALRCKYRLPREKPVPLSVTEEELKKRRVPWWKKLWWRFFK